MTTFLMCIAMYFAIPIISIKMTGRMISFKGWLVMLFLWPAAWLFMGPEELP